MRKCDWVKSAAVDSDGRAWGLRLPKSELKVYKNRGWLYHQMSVLGRISAQATTQQTGKIQRLTVNSQITKRPKLTNKHSLLLRKAL